MLTCNKNKVSFELYYLNSNEIIKLNKTRRVLLKHFIRQRFDHRSGHFQAKK
jgi:hypothetical protein